MTKQTLYSALTNPLRWGSFDPKGLINRIQHCRVAEGLVQKFHGFLLQRLLVDAVIFLTGYEDDGHFLSTTFQFLLKVKSGHSRHGDVEDQTSGRMQMIRREKFSCRRKSSSVKAELSEQVG